MGRKQEKAGVRDEGYLRTAWDWAKHISATYGCRVSVELIPVNRLGSWTIRSEACTRVGGQVERCIASITSEYPRAHYDSLPGAIWADLMALERQVQHWAGQEELPF